MFFLGLVKNVDIMKKSDKNKANLIFFFWPHSNVIEKVFMNSVHLLVCPSVCTLTRVNILQLIRYWYMLLWCTIACFLLNTIFIWFIVRLHTHSKEFRYIMVYGENAYTVYLILLYYFKHNEIAMHLWGSLHRFYVEYGLQSFIYRVTQNTSATLTMLNCFKHNEI